MRGSLLIVAILLELSGSASGQGGRSPRELRDDLSRALRSPDQAAAIPDLVRALEGEDSTETARSLFEVVSVLTRRMAEAGKEREVLSRWVNEHDREQIGAFVRYSFGSRIKAEYDEKKARLTELGDQHDTALDGVGAAVEVLSTIRGKQGLRVLGSGLSDRDLAVKEASIEALVEADPDTLSSKLARLLGDRSPRIRVAAARAAGTLRSQACLDRLITTSQKDASWVVRAAAMDALAELRASEAVMPLIESLEAEQGRLRSDAADALSRLTGESFGSIPGAWKSWWEAQGKELPASRPPRRSQPPQEPIRYYGVETMSRRVVFVIDSSESMGEVVKDAAHPEAEPANKLDRARGELRKTMSRFGPHHRFGLVVFNNIVVRWREDMVSASPDNIRAATDYVNGTNPVGKTNVFEALEAAFAIQGFDEDDRNYLEGVDTIFLLTDGTPSEGRNVDTDTILHRVRTWNASRDVVIHTIGLGSGHDAAFLRRLARENGGQYVAPDAGG